VTPDSATLLCTAMETRNFRRFSRPLLDSSALIGRDQCRSTAGGGHSGYDPGSTECSITRHLIAPDMFRGLLDGLGSCQGSPFWHIDRRADDVLIWGAESAARHLSSCDHQPTIAPLKSIRRRSAPALAPMLDKRWIRRVRLTAGPRRIPRARTQRFSQFHR